MEDPEIRGILNDPVVSTSSSMHVILDSVIIVTCERPCSHTHTHTHKPTRPQVKSCLQEMSTDPTAASRHMSNPVMADKINKLIAAGLLRTGKA